MKITIVQGAFLPVPPIQGGAVEKRWFLLGQEFARQGHDVTHISRLYGDLPESEQIAGVHHIRVKGHETPKSIAVLKFFDLLYTFRVRRVLPPADILVSNTFWLPILTRTQKYGALFVDVARMPKGQMRFYRHAAYLRANSTPVERAILGDDPKAKGRTVMIPNPLTFKADRETDFSKKQKIILYAGRIHPEKGIELLLEAFTRLQKNELKDWKLRLVGPWEINQGGGGSEWLSKLKSNFNNPHVEWVGPIFDVDALNCEYERASIFAYPSLAEKGETFGLAPLEAMAWGCIPIVSDLACFKDFINEHNGFVFDHRKMACNNLENLMVAVSSLSGTRLTSLRKNALDARNSHSVETIGYRFLDKFRKLR